jgi:excisionase family DNA binding protein
MDASTSNEFVVNGNATQPLLLTAEQAAASLAICRTKVYELLRNGELESVQIGASRRIPADALAEYVEGLRTQAQGFSDPGGEWPTVLRRQPGI